MSSTVLVCHPDSACAAVRQISASIDVKPGGILLVHYSLKGALDQVRTDQAPENDALWKHTCCELFVAATNDAEYYEFNFSPSSAWALYGFRDYRDGAPIKLEGLEPQIAVFRKPDELRLDAEIPLGYLPGVHSGVQLSIGIAAVIEALDGTLSYWAIEHPPGAPDFHRAENFAIQIALSAVLDRDRDCPANA